MTDINRCEAAIHEKPKPPHNPAFLSAPLFNYRTGMDKQKELTCNIPTNTSPSLLPTSF